MRMLNHKKNTRKYGIAFFKGIAFSYSNFVFGSNTFYIAFFKFLKKV